MNATQEQLSTPLDIVVLLYLVFLWMKKYFYLRFHIALGDLKMNPQYFLWIKYINEDFEERENFDEIKKKFPAEKIPENLNLTTKTFQNHQFRSPGVIKAGA